MPNILDSMITHDLLVTYTIDIKGYAGGTDKVRITEGYTTVDQIPSMIGIRRGVSPRKVIISLIRQI